MIVKVGILDTSLKFFGTWRPSPEAFLHHVMSKPSLHLMCVWSWISLVASSPFDLIVRTKLCSFWNFLLEELKQIYTTWDFSFHSSITFPIGTCMTPNPQKFKVKQNTGTFNSISKLMTSTNTPPLSQHNFLALQFHSHGCTILCACLCWQS